MNVIALLSAGLLHSDTIEVIESATGSAAQAVAGPSNNRRKHNISELAASQTADIWRAQPAATSAKKREKVCSQILYYYVDTMNQASKHSKQTTSRSSDYRPHCFIQF